jgi:hypothetical protein
MFFGTALAKYGSWEVKRKGDQKMKSSFFYSQGTLSFDNIIGMSVLRDEVERYESLPKLMNLYEKVNGFFDSKFESYWEEKTGLPWKEWGKL